MAANIDRELQELRDERKAKLQRDQWILQNRTRINDLWMKMEGKKLNDNEFNLLQGDPNNPDTQLLNTLLDKYSSYESYYDVMKTKGIQPPRFKEYQDVVKFYNNIDNRYGSENNFSQWLDAASEFKSTQKVGPDINKLKRGTKGRGGAKETRMEDKSMSPILKIANDLQGKFGTVSAWKKNQSVESALAEIPADVKKVFGRDNIKKGLMGVKGHETIPIELANYIDIQKTMKENGMNVKNLTRSRANQIIASYGSAGGYEQWITAGVQAKAMIPQFRELADYAKAGEAIISTPELQKQIFESGVAVLQSRLAGLERTKGASDLAQTALMEFTEFQGLGITGGRQLTQQDLTAEILKASAGGRIALSPTRQQEFEEFALRRQAMFKPIGASSGASATGATSEFAALREF